MSEISSYPHTQQALLVIVPSLQAFNFPAGMQTVNNSGATTVAEAIFKIKMMTTCKLQYMHNNTTTAPVDRRTREVTNEHTCKFRELD